jgi:3-phenylpropionate/trans-cinnamate dioxygenase ferredoxin subunit
MSNKIYNWHFVAVDIQSLGFGQFPIIELAVAEKNICLALHKETLFAFQSICPHAGAKMVNGYIDAQGNAVCPLHKYKFALKNGDNVTGEGYNMRTYPIEFREDGIFVGFFA